MRLLATAETASIKAMLGYTSNAESNHDKRTQRDTDRTDALATMTDADRQLNTCPECGKLMQTFRALQTHRYKAHNYIHPDRLQVTDKTCPACHRQFHTKGYARTHFANKRCKESRGDPHISSSDSSHSSSLDPPTSPAPSMHSNNTLDYGSDTADGQERRMELAQQFGDDGSHTAPGTAQLQHTSPDLAVSPDIYSDLTLDYGLASETPEPPIDLTLPYSPPDRAATAQASRGGTLDHQMHQSTLPFRLTRTPTIYGPDNVQQRPMTAPTQSTRASQQITLAAAFQIL